MLDCPYTLPEIFPKFSVYYLEKADNHVVSVYSDETIFSSHKKQREKATFFVNCRVIHLYFQVFRVPFAPYDFFSTI